MSTILTNAVTAVTTNSNLTLSPQGTGKVIVDGLTHPIADGSAGEFIKTNGSGVLSFAAAGGNREVLEVVTLGSNSTEEIGEANIAAGYIHRIDFFNIKCSGDVGILKILVGTGAGPTYQTSSYEGSLHGSEGSGAIDIVTGTDCFAVANAMGGTAANEFGTGFIDIYNAAETAFTSYVCQSSFYNLSTVATVMNSSGFYQATTAITGFQMKATASVNLDTGTLVLSRRKVTV